MELNSILFDLPTGSLFQARVKSNSMWPILKIGDQVLVKRSSQQFYPGDLICFYNKNKKELIVHRLLNIEKNKQGTTLFTQGDNCLAADHYPLRPSEVLGILVGKNRKRPSLIFIYTQRYMMRFSFLRSFLLSLFANKNQ